MRLITLILTFLIALYAYFYFFPLERSKEIAPQKEAEPISQPLLNQAAQLLKRRDYAALKDSVKSLSEEEKKSLRKKIYLSLLNAIHKNNPEDIENLKIAFDYLPEDPEQRQKVTHALSYRNINALRERRPLIGEPKSTREVKHAFDELIVLFAFLDDDRLVHTKDLLQQGETLFDLEEIKQRRALLARFSPYFKENPSKAIALLELNQDNKQEILSLLIETDNKAVLNEYLSYASKSGLKINPSLDTASLFYEAEMAFLDNHFEEGLFSLELLSRIDPFLRDPSLAYALALYDQEYYAAFLEEVKSIDDQTINEKRALAYIESGNREKGLEELKKIEAVSEDRSLRELAIDRLHFNDFSEGESYLNRLKNPYDYDTALHALIKFKQNAYEEALSKVRSLNEPFRQSKAIKTIEIYSLIKLQKENEALNIAQISPQSLADNPLYEPFFNTIEKEFPLSLALSELHLKANNTDLALEELEKAPSSFKTELDKAKLYLEKGKIEEAYSSIRLAANQKPINPSKEEEALFERLYGRVFYERKEYLDAFFHFKRFYDLNIESNEDLIPRIESAIKIDRYDIAKMLSERLQDSPLKSFYRFKLDHMLDNSEERISITESALKELSDHQKKEVALIYFDRGLFSEGKRIAGDLKSKALQLEIYSSIGDFRAASMLYDEVKEEKTIDAFEALALYYERTSQNQEALNALKKALELNPYRLDLQTAINSYPRPLEDLEKIIAQVKDEADKSDSPISLKVLLGRLYLNEGIARQSENKESYYFFPWEKAQLLFSNLIKVMPEAPSLYLNQGQTYILLNKASESLAVLDKGMKLAITSSELSRFKAIALAEEGKYLEGIAILESALKKNPFDPSLWSTLAFIHQEANHLLEARNAWQSYLKLKPRDSEAYFALASLAENLNNPESAIQSITKIIALDPGNEKAKTRLKKLLSDPLLRLTPREKNKLDELIK